MPITADMFRLLEEGEVARRRTAPLIASNRTPRSEATIGAKCTIDIAVLYLVTLFISYDITPHVFVSASAASAVRSWAYAMPKQAFQGAEVVSARGSALPLSLPPRGLNRFAAAEYIGISATKFDELVADGRMPQPKHLDHRRLWDRHAVDRAFDRLPGSDEDANPWDALV